MPISAIACHTKKIGRCARRAMTGARVAFMERMSLASASVTTGQTKIKGFLSHICLKVGMKNLLTAMVALLVLHAVDEQFNDSRYTRALAAMLPDITKSVG
jgi:hypothetical protein